MFILLKEKDTEQEWKINIFHIDSYSDEQIYIRSRRFKVRSSMNEIDEKINQIIKRSGIINFLVNRLFLCNRD